jgi:hypothetical protein
LCVHALVSRITMASIGMARLCRNGGVNHDMVLLNFVVNKMKKIAEKQQESYAAQKSYVLRVSSVLSNPLAIACVIQCSCSRRHQQLSTQLGA